MAARRSGPPYRRGSKWGGKINFKGGQYWVGSFDTPHEWRIAAAQLLDQLARGDDPRASDTTIGDLIEGGWPDSHRGGRDKETSLRTLRYMIKPLRRDFGNRRIDGGISRREAREWCGRVSHGAVRAAMALYRDAINDDLAKDSPFRNQTLKGSSGRKRLRVISNEEFEALVGVPQTIWGKDYGSIMSAFVRWQGETGMRPGETSNMRWPDIDFERGVVTVHESRTKTEGATTPTQDANRIALPEQAARAVRRMPRLDDEWVFTTITGQQLNKSSLHRNWSSIRTMFIGLLPDDHWLRRRIAAGDFFALYEMRHRAATWMLEPSPHGLGLSPADVAQQLGHSDGGVRVMQLYGHPDKGRSRERTRRAAAEASKRALGKPQRPTWLRTIEGGGSGVDQSA